MLGPLHQLLRRHFLAIPEQIEEGAVGAVLHHDAEHGGLDADSPVIENIRKSVHTIASHDQKNLLEQNYIWMVQLPEMLDVCLVFLLDLLHGDLLSVVFTHEYRALGSGPKPLQILDGLKWNLPII